MRKLRIISLGYFGYKNYGDDLLRESIEYIFKDHELMFTSWFPGVDVLNSADIVTVGGGSIWPDFTIFQYCNDIEKQLKTPLLVLGISARREDKTIRDQSQSLIKKSHLFAVRDQSTKQFLQNPKIKLYPDLFWWMPWNTSRVNAENCTKVAVNLRESKSCKDWHPEETVECLKKRSIEILPFSMYFGSPNHDPNISEEESEFFRRLGFGEMGNRFDINIIAESRFVVAMRYHGILISIRLRRPTISFNYHPKITSFYDDNQISELCVPSNDPNALNNAIDLLENNFSYYVDKMDVIAKQLEAEGQLALKECREIIENIAQNPRKSSLLYNRTKSLLSRL